MLIVATSAGYDVANGMFILNASFPAQMAVVRLEFDGKHADIMVVAMVLILIISVIYYFQSR